MRITDFLSPVRLEPYRQEWLDKSARDCTPNELEELYLWQSNLAGAWHETLGFTEVLVRQAMDTALKTWNLNRHITFRSPNPSEDWIINPAPTLQSLMRGDILKINNHADKARLERDNFDEENGRPHIRHGESVTHDDLVSQLTFGNLVYLLPKNPPYEEIDRNYNAREKLWKYGISQGFPNQGEVLQDWHGKYPRNLPNDLKGGYALAHALERLRQLRNRISHHEQMFTVHHQKRLEDVDFILSCINKGLATTVIEQTRVPELLDHEPHS